MSDDKLDVKDRILVYLSGAITGIEHFNHPTFQKWSAYLWDEGYRVSDPTMHFYGRTDLNRITYMHRDLSELLMCSCIALIPGWHKSSGSRLETLVALEAGIRVILLGDALDPVELLLRTEVTVPTV